MMNLLVEPSLPDRNAIGTSNSDAIPESFIPARPLTASNDRQYANCVKEMEHVHRIILWYDDVIMTKKSWCIAVWAALTAIGLHAGNVAIVLIGMASVAGFALSELILRRYQRRYVARGEELDIVLTTNDLNGYRFSLAATACLSSRRQEIWYACGQLHYSFFYALLLSVSSASVAYLAW